MGHGHGEALERECVGYDSPEAFRRRDLAESLKGRTCKNFITPLPATRCYRAYRDGKILGELFMRPIDLLFFWQGPNHCRNAYIKEFERQNYPSEYHGGVPIFESRAKGSR